MTKGINSFCIPSQSYWTSAGSPIAYPALGRDIKVDIAIVGGGLVGITVAHLLGQANLTVAVIEANRVGGGTTGHTTGKVTSQHSFIYSKLISNFGREKAQQYAEANQSVITFLEGLIKKNKIDCDFSSQAAYIYTQQDQYVKQIEEEVKAATSLGIEAHYLEDIPLPLEVKAAERFDNQAQFHPGKFLTALASIVAGEGGQIFEQTRAVDFQEGNPFTIITGAGYKVLADQVIFATHFPVYDGGGLFFTRAYADRSYALTIMAKETFPGGMYLSAGPPGRSLRSTPHNGGELIIVVGEHHRTGQGPPTGDYYRHLIQFAEDTFTVTGIPFRWSAQDYITVDEVPYAGRIDQRNDNVYVATGFRKWGITNGVVSALLIRDLIVNGESPWKPVYDPTRFTVDPTMKKSVSMGIKIAKEAATGKLEAIPPAKDPAIGKATVIKREKEKIGIYRDKADQIHTVGITCTHLGCELTWNEAELSWDCPCHGSRYSCDGNILEGPTLKPLRTATNKDD